MKNGFYEMVIAPEDYPGKKYRGKYCYEHRLVVWQETGILVDDLVVHHKNENKRDNRFENLELLSPEDHCRLHQLGKGNLIHGTFNGYLRYKCRCELCKNTWNKRCREYRQKIRNLA